MKIYKTIRLYYGNGFDSNIDENIKDGWAVFNIWTFDGPGADTPNIQKIQTIVTFIKEVNRENSNPSA